MSALKTTINLALLMGILSGTTVQGQTGTVVGTVQATGPDGQVLSIPGVRLMLTCEAQAAAIVVSDQAGQFRFASVPVGSCSLRTDVQGFKAVSAAVHSAAAEQTDVPIFLEVEALYTGLTVTGVPIPERSRADGDWRGSRRCNSLDDPSVDDHVSKTCAVARRSIKFER